MRYMLKKRKDSLIPGIENWKTQRLPELRGTHIQNSQIHHFPAKHHFRKPTVLIFLRKKKKEKEKKKHEVDHYRELWHCVQWMCFSYLDLLILVSAIKLHQRNHCKYNCSCYSATWIKPRWLNIAFYHTRMCVKVIT